MFGSIHYPVQAIQAPEIIRLGRMHDGSDPGKRAVPSLSDVKAHRHWLLLPKSALALAVRDRETEYRSLNEIAMAVDSESTQATLGVPDSRDLQGSAFRL